MLGFPKQRGDDSLEEQGTSCFLFCFYLSAGLQGFHTKQVPAVSVIIEPSLTVPVQGWQTPQVMGPGSVTCLSPLQL